MISCTRNGISTAKLSVVRVRKALIFRVPIGRTVFRPSILLVFQYRQMAPPGQGAYLLCVGVKLLLVSAVMTKVRTACIIRWSRVVRSAKNSLLSLRCNSIS